ncbi:hypothetical protein [Aurantiacibacter luteus]|uniref:Lipoprotein n=1 Tax=Aurantiacibacter luteus TaxID=1581420 RepID=A0A0G9MZS0_9SPHN|nr:hypothetical protein [Aurantiacibacter luteus]KLE34778.1 hypothetical protein AAW00_11605 [Aurantiacibacter luteus]
MKRIASPLAFSFLLLAACDASTEDDSRVEAVDMGNLPDTPRPVSPPPSPPPRVGDTPVGVNDGYPDLTPTPSTPEAERTETGARNVLLSFARAIELQEWDQAWAMMSEADRRRWSKAQFAALFSDLSDVTVAVPGGTMEGAAGSSYYTVPTEITGADPDGRPVAYTGEIVLRRVNDVPGATADQLRWHIERVTLDWTH